MLNLLTKTNNKENENKIRDKKKSKSIERSQYRLHDQIIQKQRKRLDINNKELEQWNDSFQSRQGKRKSLESIIELLRLRIKTI